MGAQKAPGLGTGGCMFTTGAGACTADSYIGHGAIKSVIGGGAEVPCETDWVGYWLDNWSGMYLQTRGWPRRSLAEYLRAGSRTRREATTFLMSPLYFELIGLYCMFFMSFWRSSIPFQ